MCSPLCQSVYQTTGSNWNSKILGFIFFCRIWQIIFNIFSSSYIIVFEVSLMSKLKLKLVNVIIKTLLNKSESPFQTMISQTSLFKPKNHTKICQKTDMKISQRNFQKNLTKNVKKSVQIFFQKSVEKIFQKSVKKLSKNLS